MIISSCKHRVPVLPPVEVGQLREDNVFRLLQQGSPTNCRGIPTNFKGNHGELKTHRREYASSAGNKERIPLEAEKHIPC